MKPSNECVALVAEFEGFKARPYLCPAGVPTIGYGCTRYADGRAVALGDKPVTPAAAMEQLRAQLEGFGVAVRAACRVEPLQHQFDALVSFAYNLGSGALSRSTLLQRHNAGDFAGAAAQFERWVNASGVKLDGLVRRRRAEAAMYMGKPWR